MDLNIVSIILGAVIGGLFIFFLKEITRFIRDQFHKSKPFFGTWISDADGDIGFQMLGGLVTIIKYKQFTIVRWFKRHAPAGKWHGHESPQ